MNDYGPIEFHIRRAGLRRSAYLGKLIGEGIFAIGVGMKHLAQRAAATIKDLVDSPDVYSTSFRRRF